MVLEGAILVQKGNLTYSNGLIPVYSQYRLFSINFGIKLNKKS